MLLVELLTVTPLLLQLPDNGQDQYQILQKSEAVNAVFYPRYGQSDSVCSYLDKFKCTQQMSCSYHLRVSEMEKSLISSRHCHCLVNGNSCSQQLVQNTFLLTCTLKSHKKCSCGIQASYITYALESHHNF
jgi:hypothetical protein